ncbi:hypothetical protein R9C00_06895 [Flammeovirgaceae bacterium SG7u.111]|nr:hypothetical protein [Flammeovirgaceae bacterium SG7u.132]WPO37170.1 hypothetical protein R9C00_06895 [Flammeovirgaceae bacterium SG7u.111]
MKKHTLVFIVAGFLLGAAQMAPKTGVPANVMKAFSQAFAGVTPYQWDMNATAFYAYFEVEGAYQYCRLDATGKITDTGKFIGEDELPEDLLEKMTGKVADAEISEHYVVSTAKGKQYLFVYDDGVSKNLILASAKGEVVRKDQFTIFEDEGIEEEVEDGDSKDEEDWK